MHGNEKQKSAQVQGNKNVTSWVQGLTSDRKLTPDRCMPIICGDLNTKLGYCADSSKWEAGTGDYNTGIVTRGAESWQAWFADNAMAAMNTGECAKNVRATYYHHNGRGSVVDYCIAPASCWPATKC